MKVAHEMTRGPDLSSGALCPQLARNRLTLGALAIAGACSLLLLATQSPLEVQLIALSATAVIGLCAVFSRGAVRVKHETAPVPPFAESEASAGARRREPLRQKRLGLVGNEMLARTRRQKQPLTVAVFDFSDLPELQMVFAGELARDLGPMIAAKLKGIARARAVVVRTGKTTFTVLLPNFDGARARGAIEAQFGKACSLEFLLGDEEVLLLPDFLVKTVRPETVSVEDVYRMLRNDLAKGQEQEARRQAYLKNERESHSRQTRPQAPMPYLAPTMPAPIGMR